MSWPRPPRRSSARRPVSRWRWRPCARREASSALFIQTDFAALEAGALYGPGLDRLGLPMERLIMLRVPRPVDALWACEEALKSRGVAIVIAELPEAGEAADFTATRRLTLAARAGGGLGLLLRHRPLPIATAATTRWQVAAAPSTPDRFGGLGRTTFDLSLNRNRRGRCGRFIVCWDHHECAFLPQTLSVGVAAAADDGSIDPQPFAARSRTSAAADAPLVVAEPVKGALRLAAVNDAAARLGLKPGMALADARAMYPRIAVADADPDADRRMLDRDCRLVRPLHAAGRPRSAGRASARHHRLRASVRRRGGVAPGHRGTARHARAFRRARRWPTPSAAPGRWHGMARTLRVLSDQTRDALLPLPLAALRIAPETVAELAQVGLKRIADVIDRPRAPLAARFGEDFVRRLDQAVGREDEPITPRLPVPPYVTERRFAEPIALEADVLGTIEHLARELVRLMERRGEGARLIEAALFRTDGKVHRIAAGTGAPLRDAARIRALFVERLAAIGDECDPGFGYDVVRLGALATERCDPVQTGLAAPDHAAELAHLDRPARRAFWAAPRDAAGAAGHAYSGICGRGRGGGVASESRCEHLPGITTGGAIMRHAVRR